MVRRSLGYRTARGLVISVALILIVSFTAAAAAAEKGAPPSSSSATGWQARIVGSDASPSRLVAVDKTQQTLFLFERHSPLRLAGKYACTTGQAEGDKLVQGDLKTPEGVYFVGKRLASGLDFEKYGTEAYTLNYPNPVDKLRRKTGYGIWIHGRGSPITPNLTEGCVSLNNTDLAVIGKDLTPGTPVALAAGVRFRPDPTPEDQAIINALYAKTREWAKAWSGRSRKFFEYYDQEAYGLAQGESFTAFRQQKERVFKSVSFIDVEVLNVQALQGPGYWVTWFQQEYRASNLSAKGVRRLYWQKDKKGELRIVGMEWAPHLSGTLTAGLNGAPVSTTAASAFKPKTVEAPGGAAPQASVKGKPAPVAAETKTASAPSQIVAALGLPEKQAARAEQPARPGSVPEAEPVAPAQAETARKPEPARAKPESQTPEPGDVVVFIERWRDAWEKGHLDAYMACYDTNALQGGRSGTSAIRAHKTVLWKNSRPKQVRLTNIRITTKQGEVIAEMQQTYTDSKSFADMGIKTLHLQPKGNAWSIVREDWSPMQQ